MGGKFKKIPKKKNLRIKINDIAVRYFKKIKLVNYGTVRQGHVGSVMLEESCLRPVPPLVPAAPLWKSTMHPHGPPFKTLGAQNFLDL